MNKRLSMLAKKRRLLLSQTAAQRQEIAASMAPWKSRLAVADKGLSAVRYVKQHPSLLLGGVGLLSLFRKKRRLVNTVVSEARGHWLAKGWATIQLLRKVYQYLPKTSPRQSGSKAAR